jgi:hypothetical protein
MTDNLFSASVLAVITSMGIAVAVAAFQPDPLAAAQHLRPEVRVVQLQHVTVVAHRQTPEATDLALAY